MCLADNGNTTRRIGDHQSYNALGKTDWPQFQTWLTRRPPNNPHNNPTTSFSSTPCTVRLAVVNSSAFSSGGGDACCFGNPPFSKRHGDSWAVSNPGRPSMLVVFSCAHQFFKPLPKTDVGSPRESSILMPNLCSMVRSRSYVYRGTPQPHD